MYLLDQHKTTCYHCGENTGKPTVLNQYPLCVIGVGNGWKNKSFTIIAKKSRGKKAKFTIVDGRELEGEAKDDEVDNGIKDFSNKEDLEETVLIEYKEDDNDDHVVDKADYGVKSDLVSG